MIIEISRFYVIRYVYNNPSNAGPYKGKTVISKKLKRGDFYYGPFGAATVVSCFRVDEQKEK